MRRLYLQIYVGFVLLAVLVIVTAGTLIWAAHNDADHIPPFLSQAIRIVAQRLPDADRPRAQTETVLARIARRMQVDASLWDARGNRLASVGRPIPTPRLGESGREWINRRGGPPALSVQLHDGRWLALSPTRGEPRRGRQWLLLLAVLAAVIAAGSYPLARRIAGRLERLRAAVDTFGGGELSARVPVEGRDEVADVARSFNRAAERIENLVDSQKRLVRSASHELRSPLARLRVALELMGTDARPELRREVATDIAELDELIEELLLAARLDSNEPLERNEPVDLLALVTEEAARISAEAGGDSVDVLGDSRLLRRLVRNLLENARRHGGDGEIEARVEKIEEDRGVRVTVADRGPGIADCERERIFAPFYRPEGAAEGHGGGYGLGLTLVREIARRHGGDARCVARDGGGTIFEVELRRASATRNGEPHAQA